MGFFDKKSTTNTTNLDDRFVADGGSIGVSGGVGALTLSDPGLVEGVFSYMAKADASLTSRSNKVLSVAENVLSKSFKLAETTTKEIGRAASGEGKIDQSQIIAALIGAVALVMVYSKKRGG